MTKVLGGAIFGTLPLFMVLAQWMNYGPLRPARYGGSTRTLALLLGGHVLVVGLGLLKQRYDWQPASFVAELIS
jgi:hypothetical protein